MTFWQPDNSHVMIYMGSVVIQMSCINQSGHCCILHDFVFGGRSVAPPMGCGNMLSCPHVSKTVDANNSGAMQDGGGC